MERIAHEICEDQSIEGVLYFELRMSPQINSNTIQKNINEFDFVLPNDSNACSPKQVVESVLKGLKRGEKDFGIHSSLILSCICGHPGMQTHYQYLNRNS